MPRGESRQRGVYEHSVRLPRPPVRLLSDEDPATAIRATVQDFVKAWYWGDNGAMLRSLHPDYVNRLITLGSDSRPMGVQGQLGLQTPSSLRTVDVRILEVRQWSASAVAEVFGWVIHLHLARTTGQWKIVNAMWESRV